MISRAVFFTAEKKVEIREVEILEPKYDEIQVKSLINGICMLEVWNYNNAWDASKIQGHEGIGIVTKAGCDVTGIREGDYVGGYLHWSEYINMKARDAVKLSHKPQNINAHLLEPASCAINAAYCTDIYPGDSAILFGAGYMGLLLIQILKHAPLSELIVVDMKEKNLELAMKYGASRVINTALQQGKEELEQLGEGVFDIAFECSAAVQPMALCTKLVRTGGIINIYSFHHTPRTIDLGAWHAKGIKVVNSGPGIASSFFPYRSFKAADQLMQGKKINQSDLITHTYSLNDIHKAMEESSLRPEGFIKSVLVF